MEFARGDVGVEKWLHAGRGSGEPGEGRVATRGIEWGMRGGLHRGGRDGRVDEGTC